MIYGSISNISIQPRSWTMACPRIWSGQAGWDDRTNHSRLLKHKKHGTHKPQNVCARHFSEVNGDFVWFPYIWVSGSHPPGRPGKHCSQMPAIGMIIATWLQDVKVFFLTVGSQSPKVGRSLSSEVWGWYGLICIFCLSWEFFEVLKFWTFKINILELNGGRMEPT